MRFDHPTPAQTKGLRQLWQEAFGDTDAFLDGFFQTAFSPERCLYAGDGGVKAALYWFDCDLEDEKIAYLYAVATAKEARGQGLCRALTEKTLEILRSRGYRGAILCPAEAGLFAMYEKMGFREKVFIREFPALAGTSPTESQSVGPEEFARLRLEYLPRGGVVQERENLAFLSQFAQFYKGEDFLLAASREGNHLFGMEFFGNEARIPGILTALGAETGSFRTPGSEKPFALYASLDGKPAPQYFGLAFD